MRRSLPLRVAALFLMAGIMLASTCSDGTSFVNWENAPIHGMDMTPDGNTLVVVNTPDNRIEVFDLTAVPLPEHVMSIPVGLEPVSVRARTNDEIWVASHISDAVNLVSLSTGNIFRTLSPGDEPTDIVFAGTPQRAFVSVSQENAIQVYDPADLDAAPLRVPIQGEDPRALATDGERVYAAIFESGNNTTLVPFASVSDPNGPYGGQNPPPNVGLNFDPPMAPGLPPAPAAGLIVKKNDAGQWVDTNGADWSAYISWDLHDHDIAILPAGDPEDVAYVTGMMNINMSLAVTHDGDVAIVGIESLNHIRFEPILNSVFSRVLIASFDPQGGVPTIADLNPHLSYASSSVPEEDRVLALADPRSIVWSSSENRGFVSGMGSNNVIETNTSGTRLGRVEVGAGASSLVLDEDRDQLYVLNRFDATISVVDTESFTEVGQVGFFDPTPAEIRLGRPLLYDAHLTSGTGHVSCASCHIDGRMDHLAWDLGNPAGTVEPFDQTCITDGLCEDFHPVKGPMVTQTLQGIIGTEPLHWRGDRGDFSTFDANFTAILGDDEAPSADDMARFEAFAETIRFPPNPFRNLDNSLRDEVIPQVGGNPVTGVDIFFNDIRFAGEMACGDCHIGHAGTSQLVIPFAFGQRSTPLKVAQLRSVYDKSGLSQTSNESNRGFGMIHDGSEVVFDILGQFGFNFPPGPVGAQERRDVEAYLFSVGRDTHTAVGKQVTLDDGPASDADSLDLLDALVELADSDVIGLVVKGRIDDEPRGGYLLTNDTFQMDRPGETLALGTLVASTGPGSELTFTAVPYESRIRIGVDRDADGSLDGEESRFAFGLSR